jgi:hypothetical protein
MDILWAVLPVYAKSTLLIDNRDVNSALVVPLIVQIPLARGDNVYVGLEQGWQVQVYGNPRESD